MTESWLYSTEFAHRFVQDKDPNDRVVYVTYCGYRVLEVTVRTSQRGKIPCERCEHLTKNLRLRNFSVLIHAPTIPATSTRYLYAKCGKIYDTAPPNSEAFFTEENVTCMECLTL